MKARLYVRNPLDVNLVAEVEIPPFKVLPEALLSGSRYFHLAKPSRDIPAALAYAEANYIEGMVFAIDVGPPITPEFRRDIEWVKSSLRAMVYCVGHLESQSAKTLCFCRDRAAQIYDDDGPIFKPVHDGLAAISFLVTALAIASGHTPEEEIDPEFVENQAKMNPEWVEAMLGEAVGGLKALLRGTSWEKPAESA